MRSYALLEPGPAGGEARAERDRALGRDREAGQDQGRRTYDMEDGLDLAVTA